MSEPKLPSTNPATAPGAEHSADPIAEAFGAEPLAFPDDSPLASGLRKVDHALGVAEQAVVFALLALVVLVAAFAALHDRLTTEHIGRWWHYIVRGGTFSIAMFAAVYATQQQRHLAMDLISRRLSPRGRLILGLALKLFTIGVVALLFQSGLHQREVVGGAESLNILIGHINDADIVTTISIGAALIALHCALHGIIDIDYLIRGKLPPERARSAH